MGPMPAMVASRELPHVVTVKVGIQHRGAANRSLHTAKQPRAEVSRAVLIELGVCRLAGTEVGLDPCQIVSQQVVGAVHFLYA